MENRFPPVRSGCDPVAASRLPEASKYVFVIIADTRYDFALEVTTVVQAANLPDGLVRELSR